MALMPLTKNGRKPGAAMLARPARPSLAERVDDLFALRDLIRQSVAAEKGLTAEVIAAMQAAKVATVEGARSVAKLGDRTNTVVDPALFLEATGSKGYAALVVRLEPARELLSGEDLVAISETTTCPVLRIEARKVVAS